MIHVDQNPTGEERTNPGDRPSSAPEWHGQHGGGEGVVASGNIGCLTQLRVHLEKIGSPVRVRHTMQVLRDAYRKE